MSRHVTWNVNLFQNGEPADAWDEHNMGPAGPMKIEFFVLKLVNFHANFCLFFLLFLFYPSQPFQMGLGKI